MQSLNDARNREANMTSESCCGGKEEGIRIRKLRLPERKKAEDFREIISGNASVSGGKREFKKKEFRKKDLYRPVKIGDDPNLIYGQNFEDEPITLEQVVTEMGEITVHGKIINFDTREIRNEKTIIIFAVTDFTDTITMKMFARNDQLTGDSRRI